MDDLKGYFDSLATEAVTIKDKLKDLVAANLALAKIVVNLINTNSHLVKKVKIWTNNSGSGGGGGRRPERKWYNNCKRNP